MINVTSPFSQLFLAIQERIKDQVPEIIQTDLDLGQLDFYDQRPAVAFPCLLIDFPNTDYTNEAQLTQWATPIMYTKLGFSPFSSASSFTPDISKEKALQFFEIENKVVAALHGWTPIFPVNNIPTPIAESLIRTNATTEKRQDPFRVRNIIWITAGEDAVAQPSIQTVTSVKLNLFPQSNPL